jgi:TusA-related sulfurtransferase
MECLKKGEELTLIATDPMTELDIPHFCTRAGHILIRQWKEQGNQEQKTGDQIFFLIKKNQE